MDDLINRQDAINACLNGWNKGYDEILIDIKTLPSAEPKIIRCKDCKHWCREILNGIEYVNFSSCDLNHCGDGHNFYCADAERREP